jgi:glycosyltransferase involved in cell wall biosynthesis
MKPLVSIIIPTLNEVHSICPTLDAIAANWTAHEVIVVDGEVRTERLISRSKEASVSCALWNAIGRSR